MLQPPSGKHNYSGFCKCLRENLLEDSSPAAQSIALDGRLGIRIRLFLLGRRCCRRLRRRRLSLHRLGFDPLQHRRRAAAPAGVNRECDGGNHERHGRPGRSLRKCTGCAARTERRLAALPAKGRGNVSALAALQQHDNDDEEAHPCWSAAVNQFVPLLSGCCFMQSYRVSRGSQIASYNVKLPYHLNLML